MLGAPHVGTGSPTAPSRLTVRPPRRPTNAIETRGRRCPFYEERCVPVVAGTSLVRQSRSLPGAW